MFVISRLTPFFFFFFFNDTATTEIYTLSLHDALPISYKQRVPLLWSGSVCSRVGGRRRELRDRKSTRLNSSHQIISYAVFCLKKKKKPENTRLERHRAADASPYCRRAGYSEATPE